MGGVFDCVCVVEGGGGGERGGWQRCAFGGRPAIGSAAPTSPSPSLRAFALLPLPPQKGVFFKPGERFRDLVGSPYYVAPEVLRKVRRGVGGEGVGEGLQGATRP